MDVVFSIIIPQKQACIPLAYAARIEGHAIVVYLFDVYYY